MSEQQAAGNIYDLGYRHYEGPRLGRLHAVQALFLSSMRSAFGLGRGAMSKLFPVGLAIFAFVPAVIQLGIGAVVSDDVEIFRPEEYYNYTRVIIILFCAAVAPELVGRDQRNRTLSLYFSRAMLRRDYALAKYAAMAAALGVLTLGPQLLLYLGNGFATNDLGGYARDEWQESGPIVASAVVLCTFMAAFSLAIACQSSRRMYTTVAILGVVMLTAPIAGILSEVGSSEVTAVATLFSPFDINQAATAWFFDGELDEFGAVEVGGLPYYAYVVANLAWTAIGLWVIFRRYETIQP